MTRARKANELNKDYGPAWMVQGLSGAALGQYDVAAAAFTAALALPGSKACRSAGDGRPRHAARPSDGRGRSTRAAADRQIADSLHARIHTTLAGVRLAQGRSADAARLAESALQISAGRDHSFRGRAYPARRGPGTACQATRRGA